MERKTTVWIFQATNWRNLMREDLDMAKKKGSLKRETEYILIVAQNNARRTNYVKSNIDKMQQNSKCWLCDDRDGTINHTVTVPPWGKKWGKRLNW